MTQDSWTRWKRLCPGDSFSFLGVTIRLVLKKLLLLQLLNGRFFTWHKMRINTFTDKNGRERHDHVTMNRYFRGQSLIALCVGILLAIGFKIIDFPLAIILGLFIGLLNMIPYLQTIGIIPMVILSLLRSAESGENFWIIFGLSLLVLGIVQCIQDLYLTPRIMGKAMGLNPAIILLSLSIWGILLGFIGLIIALPLTTLCLSYYKRFILEEKEPEPVPDNSKETNK